MNFSLWQKLSFALSGIAASAVGYYLATHGTGPAEFFTAFLILIFSGWIGALIGALVEWKRGRSPLTPLFKGEGFGWYYKRRYWFRFAIMFAAAWIGFLLLAESVALVAGEKEEARLFLTSKGALVLIIFLAVFAAEGALIGGLVDLVKYLREKK